MVFEYWEFEDGHTVFSPSSDPTEYQQQLEMYDLTEDGCERMWTFEANSYNEATQAVYDRKGWGRYQPIE